MDNAANHRGNGLTRGELRRLLLECLLTVVVVILLSVLMSHNQHTDRLWKWIVSALDLPLIFATATFLAWKAGLFGWKTRLAFWLCTTNIVFAVVYYNAGFSRLFGYDMVPEVQVTMRAFLVFCLYRSTREMLALRGGIPAMWHNRRFPRWRKWLGIGQP